MSVMRNVSVPYGISTPDKPHIASTRLAHGLRPEEPGLLFRADAGHGDLLGRPGGVDFSEGSGERTLTLAGGQTYAGDATAKFRKSAKPFVFLFGV